MLLLVVLFLTVWLLIFIHSLNLDTVSSGTANVYQVYAILFIASLVVLIVLVNKKVKKSGGWKLFLSQSRLMKALISVVWYEKRKEGPYVIYGTNPLRTAGTVLVLILLGKFVPEPVSSFLESLLTLLVLVGIYFMNEDSSKAKSRQFIRKSWLEWEWWYESSQNE